MHSFTYLPIYKELLNLSKLSNLYIEVVIETNQTNQNYLLLWVSTNQCFEY